MLILITAILCSVAVSILLKVARGKGIVIAQSIAVNYLVASSLCLLLLNPQPQTLLTPSGHWLILLALGLLLPSVFLIMAAAVERAGIALSDAAQRLSLFIPILAAFVLFGEAATGSKLLGIAVAFVALGCLLFKPGLTRSSASNRTWLMLLGVWIGYGVIDILFKELAKTGAAFPSSLLVTFVLAGLLILAWLFWQKTPWNRTSLLAGVLLGVLNFGNIYFYIRAHQTFPQNPTLVFAAMNIGVISLGTLVGAGLFREKLSWVNFLGILLAIIAILLLIPR